MNGMTVVVVKDLLEKYQKLDVINQSSPINDEFYPMLIELCDSENGRDLISLLVRALWFYTAGGRLRDLDIEAINKIDLIRLVRLTEEKIADMERVMEVYNQGFIQRAKVACGEKIAYRKDAGLEQVNLLWKSGFTYMQIAERLNVSRATVASRIKELKRLERLEEGNKKSCIQSRNNI